MPVPEMIAQHCLCVVSLQIALLNKSPSKRFWGSFLVVLKKPIGPMRTLGIPSSHRTVGWGESSSKRCLSGQEAIPLQIYHLSLDSARAGTKATCYLYGVKTGIMCYTHLQSLNFKMRPPTLEPPRRWRGVGNHPLQVHDHPDTSRITSNQDCPNGFQLAVMKETKLRST